MQRLKTVPDRLYDAFRSLINDQYTKEELDQWFGTNCGRFTESTRKGIQSKVSNVLFQKHGNLYTKKKIVAELIQLSIDSNEKMFSYVLDCLLTKTKLDYTKLCNKSKIFLWILKQLPSGYLRMETFVEKINEICGNIQTYEICDYLDQFHMQYLEWDRRCGLNQIIIFHDQIK
jgi:hypothetical protein